MKTKKRVVITGIGIISSLGSDEKEIVENILKRKTNICKQKIRVGGELWHSFLLHKAPNFSLDNFYVNPKYINFVENWTSAKLDKDLSYFLATVSLALKDSGLVKKSLRRGRAALVLAHENPGLSSFFVKIFEETSKFFKKAGQKLSKTQLIDHLYNRCEQKAYDLQTFMYLFFMAKAFDIHEYSIFLNNACASGVYAMEAASRQIQLGNSNIVVVSAVDRPDVYKYLWFKNRSLYSEDGLIRPFCENSNGIVFGEGGASLIMEDFDHAKKRKAKIYAEYLGGGFALESWKVTFPDVSNDYYSSAFLKAIKNSGVNYKDIDFINPHGVGIKVTDTFEANTISNIFKTKKNQPLISAYKPLIGHNLGGSALIETAILMLSLKRNIIFPTLNSDPNINNLNLKLVKEPLEKKLYCVAKMECVFAGFNGVSIFRGIT